MSSHNARVSWELGDAEFTYDTYPRQHTWAFESGVTVAASAAPDFRGDPERVDPEEAFVAAVAGCHLLTFLAIAARKRIVVERYEDAAVGLLEKGKDGKLEITRVELRPRVTFADPGAISPEDLARLHRLAHENCFIARSVRSEVVVAGNPAEA